MKTTQNKLVPKLRFPGFEGEWKVNRLDEVAKIQRGRFSPRPRNDPRFYNGNIPFVQTSDVVNAGGKIHAYTQTLNEEGLSVSKLFSAGSILITIAANIGYSGVLQIDMACPDSLIGIVPNSTTHNYFLNFYLSTQQKKMDYLAPEGAQKNINVEFLAPYKIPVPTLPEQEKIAGFLSSVDTKLQQLREKKDLLAQYKKGLMQQLFSGALRFKDDQGKDFPDWEEKRLGDVVTFRSGGTPSLANEAYWGGKIPWISAASMYGKYYSKSDRSLTPLGVRNGSRIAKAGTLLLLTRGSMLFNRIPIGIAEIDVAFNQDVKALETNEYVMIEFLWQWFSAKNQFLVSQVVGTGIGAGKLDTEDLKALNLSLPSLPEQQKIATFLSALDQKIEMLATTIAGLAEWKKGLLQRLFV